MKQIWNEEELAQYWSLIYEELELLKTKPQKHHLIFCMQLKYYKYYGAFPETEKDISEIPLQYISEQLDIYDDIFSYEWESRTARRHRQEILTFLKIRKLDSRDRAKLISWLTDEIFPKGIQLIMSKLLYYCFVEEFDLSARKWTVVNESNPQWDIDISKLSFHSANYVLRERYKDSAIITP